MHLKTETRKMTHFHFCCEFFIIIIITGCQAVGRKAIACLLIYIQGRIHFFSSKDIIYCIRLLLVQPVFLTKQILFFYVVSISFVLKILSQQLDLANNVLLLLLAGHTSVYKKFSWWAQWSAVRCPLGNILSISFGTQLSCEFE